MTSLIRKSCGIGEECKQAGVANCEGCSKVFCTRHFTDHRRVLNEQMNVMIGEYDEFTNTIMQETDFSNIEALIQKVDEWEDQSIEKVKNKAAELRTRLLELRNTHVMNISTELESSAKQIQKSQEQDDFIETDLRRWQEKLSDLRSNLDSLTIIIHQHDDIPLIHNQSVNLLTSVNDELFDRTYTEAVEIQKDGKVASGVRFFMTYTEIRGKNSYEFGCHKIRLQIEHGGNEWTFLGINSKSTPLKERSFSSKSAYGWCNSNYVYSNGLHENNTTHPTIRINKNDIITLFFDCDNRQISMVNETANTRHQLNVDIDNCPFPWQLHVIFRAVNSRIHILPS